MKIKLTSIFILLSLAAFGQDSFKDLVSAGKKNYSQNKYGEALSMFLKADSVSKNNPDIAYQIGQCYMQITEKALNAVSYFEKALTSPNTPVDVHQYLGILYHQTFMFDKAIQQFSDYLQKAKLNKNKVAYIQQMINASKNAKAIAGQKTSKYIKQLSMDINSGYAEYAPYVSADLNRMIFTRLEFDPTNENNRQTKKFFETGYNGKTWQQPAEIKLPQNLNTRQTELAGISANGQIIYLSIDKNTNIDLYSAEIKNNIFANIQPLDTPINSEFDELAITFSIDGNTCVFSSNRPGGYGETDLYMSYIENNKWTTPQNLGSDINTQFNENNPFLYAENENLIFASEGHQTIGGYDLFESNLNEKNRWTKPIPIDYANTVYDDRYMQLDTKYKKALFAKSINLYPERTKIYYAEMSANIPLTMLDVSVEICNKEKNPRINIQFYDHETRQNIQYIYHSVKYQGRCLVILPPGRNYDMVIEADGFLPYLINVHLPEQSYFYEIYQGIKLEHIEENTRTIGENITIRNTFYDIYQEESPDVANERRKYRLKNQRNIKQFIDNAIQNADSILSENSRQKELKTESNPTTQQRENYEKLFKLIGDALENTDTLALALIEQNTLHDDILITSTYYSADTKKNMIQSVYGSDTLQTLPLVNMPDNRKTLIPDVENLVVKEKERRQVYSTNIFFDFNDASIHKQYLPELNKTINIMQNNPNIIAELYGYTDPIGSAKHNMRLSDKRVQAVFEYMNQANINKSQFNVVPCGKYKPEPEQTDTDDTFKNMRRVEIKILEIQR